MGMLAVLAVTLGNTRYNNGVRTMQWGVTVTGVSVLVIAAWVLLQKHDDSASAGTVLAHKAAGIVLAALGVGLIAYVWLVHETI